MIEVIRGSSEKPVSTDNLIEFFLEKSDSINGILYIGYPIVGTPNGAISLDAILISREHGVIVFDIEEGVNLEDRSDIRDEIFNNIQAKLLQNKELVDKRTLKVNLEVVTYAPASTNQQKLEDTFKTGHDLNEYLKEKTFLLEKDVFENLVSVVQTVTSIRKTSKRTDVVGANTKGAKLKKLEASIANLDRHQSAAVIETTEGLQRIRGLAGSGKTIILALKVAYLHSTHPDWNIAVTFNTRTLKNQFTDLITKFTIEHKNEEPNWEKIKILQAWGSPSSAGIYYDTCIKYGIEYLDYGTAKYKTLFAKDAFALICDKALKDLSNIKNFTETYDAILIDEAQDLPGSFLKLCYKILKNPKRLIWAYDELQKLNETSIETTEELFGVTLANTPKKPKQDIILEKCYRNSRPLLVTAQGLGFGIYRDEGLVQMFDRPALWKEIGYTVSEGELEIGSKVILKRTDETSPAFLEEHSPIGDLITLKNFENNQKQLQWIADEIENNIKNDELYPQDIVVINCDPFTTEINAGPLRALLSTKGIKSHIAGVTSSRDKFYENQSVTFTGIYRAKGNEAAMVYIMNSQYAFGGDELIKKRNILFTAITRSKAWVRICGYGTAMQKLELEYEKIKQNSFELSFTYPTVEEMNKLNIIHRDITKDEKYAIKESNSQLKSFLRNMKEGKIRREDLEPETLDQLKKVIENNESTE